MSINPGNLENNMPSYCHKHKGKKKKKNKQLLSEEISSLNN